MTKPAEFEANILGILNYLDKNVMPPGSHMVFVGLADGLELWDNLHNRTHPIGVSYKDVYDYLNCLNISPCWVWMNSNATIREAGQKRANELSAIYPKIIREHKFQNFDLAYYDFPIKEIAKQWIKDGGKGLWQLIEPVDGFHPNQIANSLMADFFWKNLNANQPHFFGGANPNNAAIAKQFGDQGGY
jgi:acyloxyacyl hydrolase